MIVEERRRKVSGEIRRDPGQPRPRPERSSGAGYPNRGPAREREPAICISSNYPAFTSEHIRAEIQK